MLVSLLELLRDRYFATLELPFNAIQVEGKGDSKLTISEKPKNMA